MPEELLTVGTEADADSLMSRESVNKDIWETIRIVGDEIGTFRIKDNGRSIITDRSADERQRPRIGPLAGARNAHRADAACRCIVHKDIFPTISIPSDEIPI